MVSLVTVHPYVAIMALVNSRRYHCAAISAVRGCYTDAVTSYQRRSIGLSPCAEVEYSPSIDWKSIIRAQRPVIIRGLGGSWAAVNDSHPRCWKRAENLKYGAAIPRTSPPSCPEPEPVVSVEFGGNYMSTDMTLVSVEYAEFIDYVFGTGQKQDAGDATLPHIYLAQQEVGSVTPHLLGDIPAVPEITRYSTQPMTINNSSGTTDVLGDQKDNIYRVNIWISPRNIVSPAHFDPYHNLLCQLVGQKEVLLFDRDMTAHLTTMATTQAGHGDSDTSAASAPAGMRRQSNSSCIDFETEDLRAVRLQYPGYDKLRGVQAVLSAGDGLFVPYKWWHYCKSLTSSVSVNYWWL